MSVTRYFSTRGDDLMVGDVPVRELAREFGTPLFVYDQSIFAKKVDLIHETFPEGFRLYYSVKANPNPEIARYFVSRGCGLEVASGGELYLSLSCGAKPEDILFAGPAKSEAELEYAIDQKIGEIHVESLTEIERIETIARQRGGVRVNVSVRVNPSGEAQGGAMRMGGKPAQFGVDEEILDSVLDRVLGSDELSFRGIHLFTGTQILDAKILLQQYRKGVEIALRAADFSGEAIHTVDFGGGLGIPYFPNESELDTDVLRPGLEELMSEARASKALAETQFIIEPGRFLVGDGGVYVTSVNTVKESRGKKYLILDGGMNHQLAASGNLGQVIKRNFPIVVLNKMSETATESVEIVGPLCTPLDTLGRNATLAPAEVGDLVGVLQSGAYGRSASPTDFLSHPAPAEVLVDGKDVRLVRQRGDYTDFVKEPVV